MDAAILIFTGTVKRVPSLNATKKDILRGLSLFFTQMTLFHFKVTKNMFLMVLSTVVDISKTKAGYK